MMLMLRIGAALLIGGFAVMAVLHGRGRLEVAAAA